MMVEAWLQGLVESAWASAIGAGAVGLWVELAVEGTVLLAVASLAALALRGASAAARHLVWALAATGLLLLPLTSLAPAAWELEVPLPASLTPAEVGEADVGASASAGAVLESSPRAGSAVERMPRSGAGAEAPPRSGAAAEAMAPAPGGIGRREAREAGGSSTPGAAAATTATPGTATMPTWPALLLGLWAAGALAVLLLVALERARCRRLARRAVPVKAPIRRTAQRVARTLGLARAPTLLRSPSRSMPMTWGVRRTVVLLPSDVGEWGAARLESVLLHELAHVRRRDYLLQLVAAAACAVHWFNPLAWLAARRMREERELACDDEALRAGSRPSDYAAELLELARSLRTEPGTALAAMAMARPSSLSDRLAAVLEERRPRSPLGRRLVARSLLAAAVPLALLTAAAPFPGFEPGPTAPHMMRWMDDGSEEPGGLAKDGGKDRHDVKRGEKNRHDGKDEKTEESGSRGSADENRKGGKGEDAPARAGAAASDVGAGQEVGCWDSENRSTNLNRNDDAWTLSVLGDDCRLHVSIRGEVELDDDFDGIRRVGHGGLFLIEEEEGGTRRRLEVRPGADGEVERTWRVDGAPRPFDADARRWLERMLPPILRRTGLAAEERTRWILAREGTGGVLRELGRIPSDAVHRRYAVALVEAARLGDGEMASLLELAIDEVGSDGEMAELLVQVVARRPEALSGRAGEAFWAAAATVGSDSEHRTMLLRLLDLRGGEEALARGIYASAREAIGSDSEMVGFLLAAAERQPDAARRPAGSGTAGDASGAGRAADGGYWSAVPTIGSDSEMRAFLVELERRLPGVAAGPAADDFWSAAASVGSDSEHRVLLEGLLEDEGEGSPVLEGALRSARAHIGSDSELAGFLVGFADRFPAAARGRLAGLYREAAAAVGSDSERRRAMAALPGGR